MKKLITVLLIVFVGCQQEFIVPEQAQMKSASIKSEQIIVKYKTNPRESVGQIKKQFHGLTVLSVANAELALQKLKHDPDVEYAERDFIVSIPEDGISGKPTEWNPNKGRGHRKNDTIPVPPVPPDTSFVSNDYYFVNSLLWGMCGINSVPANQYGSGAAGAWYNGNIGKSDVYVGVIDEGIMYFHEDLSGQVWTNPFEIANDGIDNDGNGYIDDSHGWDFLNDNNSIFDGVTDDHGTHVSGTIGAKGGNGIGVAGMCWNVKLISGKFLEGSGWTSDAIEAIYYMIDLKVRHGINIVALSNSWGGGGYSQTLYDAIVAAGNNNILFVCAAGNSSWNIDQYPSYPASYDCDNMLTVAAINSSGMLSYFSNYGIKSVDLGAPGQGVVSTIPISSTVGGYSNYDGTSMACPHVSGACALYAATHPTATSQEIKTAILNSVISTTSLNAKCVSGGRLNVANF